MRSVRRRSAATVGAGDETRLSTYKSFKPKSHTKVSDLGPLIGLKKLVTLDLFDTRGQQRRAAKGPDEALPSQSPPFTGQLKV